MAQDQKQGPSKPSAADGFRVSARDADPEATLSRLNPAEEEATVLMGKSGARRAAPSAAPQRRAWGPVLMLVVVGAVGLLGALVFWLR